MNYEEKAKEMMELVPKLHAPLKTEEINRFSQGERCLLMRLHENGGRMMPSELAKLLKVSTPRVASILKLVEEKGLVTREDVSGDRRKVHVVLTQKGEEQVLHHKKNVYEKTYAYLNMLGDEDAEALLRIMRKTEEYFREEMKNNIERT